MFQHRTSQIIILFTIITVAKLLTVAVSANLLSDVPKRFEQQGYRSVIRKSNLPGKLEYHLAESEDNQESRGGALLSYISSLLFHNKLIGNVLSYFDRSKSTDQVAIHNNKNSDIDILTDSETAKFEASLSHDAPTRTASAGRKIKDEEWSNTLFGPTGVLTTIFRLMDDRRRDSIPRRKLEEVNIDSFSQYKKPHSSYSGVQQKPHNATRFQSDFLSLTDFFNNAKPIDLAKVFNAFLTNQQGGFEDPVAELPEFLGICNRLSCGDIYKAIDQFRKSDFFTNFQTALQLIQDPKGWEILGDLLSNPELISQLTKDGDLESFLGSSYKEASKLPNGEVGPGDGNLGTDFSSMVNEGSLEKMRKPSEVELPEIAENIDSPDYYSAVEHGEDVDNLNGGSETSVPPEESLGISMVKADTDNEDISLPEISESVDENIEIIAKPEVSLVNNSFTRPVSSVQRPLQIIVTKALGNATIRPTVSQPPATVETVERLRLSTANSHSVRNDKGVGQHTTLPPTTKNFRRNNDYYAMYYDD